jgi:hypothetical protein
MSDRAHWRRMIAVGAVVGLGLTACGGGGGTTDPTESETTTEPAGTETGSPMEVAMGPGVTAEPCPDAVNADNGCIYLGIISDLTDGPFAPLAKPLTDAQVEFWAAVNEAGGIGGAFDVDVTTYQEDAKYNAEAHAQSYTRIREDVAALAQSLGTSQTLGVFDQMEADNMVAVPATWWSGWGFTDLILETGSNYCVDAMNGVDYLMENLGGAESIAIIGIPGDYGEDWKVGVKAAAEAHNLTVVREITQVPIVAGGTVDQAVSDILSANPRPDAIFMATGPTEVGQTMGGVFQQDNSYTPLYIGAAPSFNKALLESAVGPLMLQTFFGMAPYAAYDGESAAHDAIRAAIPDPVNDGMTFGWIQSYPLLDALEAAYAAGDLTREGIRAAAGSLTPDWRGAAPAIDYGGEPDATVVRDSVVHKPSEDATTGIEIIADRFAGSTAADYDLSAPCFAPEGFGS